MALRISAKQLSLGHEGDDVERVHRALGALGRVVPVGELSGRLFGPSTAAVVGALQVELGVETTSVIDEATVAAINDALGRVATGERVVRGRVIDENGRPFKTGFIEVRLQRPSGEVEVAQARLDDEGGYEARYKVPEGHVGVVDVRVVVTGRSGPLETIPSGTSVIADAGVLEVVDFVLARGARHLDSELDVMIADLEPLLGGRALADLEEKEGAREVSLLASQSGYSTAQVAALVRAHQLARETGVPAAVFHGLLRNGLPSTTAALLAAHPELKASALRAAVSGGLVPATIDGRRVEEFLPDVRSSSRGAELEALLGDQLEADDRASFIAEYWKRSDDPGAFWKAIADDRRFAARADRLKLTVQLGALTNHHPPLVKALLGTREIRQARDLVRVTDAAWKELVHGSGGVPAGTPGATADEQLDNYLQQIRAQVEAAFPTAFVAARLGESPVARFLDAHPTYDLEKTYPARFFKDNAGADRRLTPEARRDLEALQRLYRLTARASETIALASEGIGSSLQIARLDREVFAMRMAGALSAERAHDIHANATRSAGLAIALFGEYAAKLDRTGLRALPRTDVEKRAELAAASIPNWETLFGSFDLCACEECNSAHGAAAYFVDILQFLSERGVKDALFARRPDLGEIELSCENTNTLVPAIDLVNELLENAVAPPPPFTPFTLPVAREDDLDEPIATAQLCAAFDPPLAAGSRVEIVQPGKRWRVVDESFSYSIVKQGNALEVTARSRQTSGCSLERLASPQYVNRAAYRELAEAVYPWTLPFDLASTEANVFLAHLGVTRRDLIDVLRSTQEPFDPDAEVSVRVAAEGLGLTDTQRKIIVDEPLTPPRAAKDFWGGATPGSLTTVREILDRSGLSFAELDQLVATRFVDPTNKVRIRAKQGEPIDTCDPTRLEVDGLTAAVMDRMHRFVRLHRALGWAIPDVDRAVVAVGSGSGSPKLTNSVLVRLDHLRELASALRLSITETLALWEPIDPTAPGSTRHSVLAEALGLSIAELASAIELTQLAPFDVQRSHEALRLVDVVKAVRAAGFSFAQLDYLLRHRASEASSFVPREIDMLRNLSELRDALRAADAATAPDMVVRDRIAAVLGITAELAAGVLARVRHGGETAESRLLAVAEIAGDLSRANANVQLEVLEKLHKVAVILQAIELPESQLDWLFRDSPWLSTAPDLPAQPAPFASWSSLLDLVRLRRDLAVEAGALEAILGALTRVATAPAAERLDARNALVAVLVQWLGWPAAELEALLGAADDLDDRGLLGARVPDDYRASLLVRVGRAMKVVKRLGVGARAADVWCEDSITAEDAKAIRIAAKARHDEDAWLRIAPELQDALRDAQRAALVDYLVAQPSVWGASATAADANDLLAHLLVDIEMTACQHSSRIKQAIGSVQLFAQRALLGLEPGVSTADARWSQWSWMKSFRIWEANRKIWLYPENFIEAELRDEKTPQFEELEDELLQAELDDATAETAVRHYVEKLDELARLEVAGVYEDEDHVLHVFGRTDHAPRVLYYRRRVGMSWTSWERVPLEVEADHLIPIKWNRRLMLIWPVFAEKAFPKSVTNPPPGGTLDEADRYWEIRLAWGEYQNGSWSGPSLSEPVSLVAYQNESDILFGERVEPPRVQGQPGISLRPIGSGLGGGRPGPLPVPPKGVPGAAATGKRKLVSTELFAFKALPRGEQLSVRGYLRRDYRGAAWATDREIACVFGEFRFAGCRKIVSTAHVGQISRRNLALAPTGTKFDGMRFTQTGASLVLFDGTFPVFRDPLPTVDADVNVPASIAADPASVLENKLNIPVLGAAPSSFRLLAPHQDLQFVCDRPFFYSDRHRTFMVTSTGRSGKIWWPDLGKWIAGNVGAMARASYFPNTPPAPDEDVVAPLTLLVPDGAGRRIAKQLAPVTLQPAFRPLTLLPVFFTTRRYQFTTFSHPFACELVQRLDRFGVRGLLSLESQNLADPHSFAAYAPAARVDEPHPNDAVELHAGAAFEVYNWELFLHIPLLVAERLRANQRFADAQRWFHYIFDPTGSVGGDAPQRYWRMKPFHDRLAPGYEAESVKTLEEMIADGPSDTLRAAVAIWRDQPFSPHAIARLRTTAYQKTVVMKYVDNLIAWGDQLFARDTLETINEAMQLYILAAEILGREPEIINRDVRPRIATFNSLELSPGGLGNTIEQIELLFAGAIEAPEGPEAAPLDVPASTALLFCVPENAKLLGYWRTVADRLFKIRNCMNLAGRVRQLPLFEPPIDPALLVRARAAGLDITEVISDTAPDLPSYRFSTILQRAGELAGEVRNLGSALLSVLEKRDAEALANLRSSHEVRLLQSIRDVRVRQVAEAKAHIAALQHARKIVEARKTYYEAREPLSAKERSALTMLRVSLGLTAHASAARGLAAVLQVLGVLKLGPPTTAGAEIGPAYVADGLLAGASVSDGAANVLGTSASIASRAADFERRLDDWRLQAELATTELQQVDQQLIANEIRQAIAERELRNHDQQLEQAREVEQQLRAKFTNQDLYQFSISQLSGLYFQSYQLACELAKRAERCMQHELGHEYGATSFIRFGHWDTLHKGLWAGEHLAHDLKRLEIAYLDGNIREYELTKHVSLESLAPEQLLALKTTGACDLEIPEWFFDLDTPGHYMRRIKAVGITLPCVTGPYTTVHCKLQLHASSYRRTTDLAGGYVRSESDVRFVDGRKVGESIVTSTGQNDAGLFEANLRDERYLPFEGAGAISTWHLELPSEIQTFDYATISDAVLHLRYTARDGGDALRAEASAAVVDLLDDASEHPLTRLISLRHDFPDQWYALSAARSPVRSVTIDLARSRFPFFARDRTIRIRTATAMLLPAATTRVAVAPGPDVPALTEASWSGSQPPGPWSLATDADPSTLDDLFLIVSYTIAR